jgi:uncharacterized protein (TIGR02611 family)
VKGRPGNRTRTRYRLTADLRGHAESGEMRTASTPPDWSDVEHDSPVPSMSAMKRIGGYARTGVILVIGLTVLLAGVAMLALPGPGIVVIILGLVILSQEFAWAERLLDTAVEKLAASNSRAQESRHGKRVLAASGAGLILAGLVVFAIWSQFWVVGISLIIAGVIGLCTLHPRVHAWVDERAATGINATDDVPAR